MENQALCPEQQNAAAKKSVTQHHDACYATDNDDALLPLQMGRSSPPHSHKKRKGSLETRTKPAVFSL